MTIQSVSLAHDAPFHREFLLPDLVAQHKRRRRPGFRILRRQRTAHQSRNAEKLESVASHAGSPERFRRARPRHQHAFRVQTNRSVEHVVLLLIIQELRRLKELAPKRVAAAVVMDHDGHQSLAIGIGKRLQQHVVYHAEDRGG